MNILQQYYIYNIHIYMYVYVYIYSIYIYKYTYITGKDLRNLPKDYRYGIIHI